MERLLPETRIVPASEPLDKRLAARSPGEPRDDTTPVRGALTPSCPRGQDALGFPAIQRRYTMRFGAAL
jgi:hypothetical protein